MPHRRRADPGSTFHVVNRATTGQLLFRDFGEYLVFLRLLARVLARSSVELCAFCLMPNHWHLIVRARTVEDLSRFMQALSREHAQALRRWRGTVGRGAVYQGRYRASLIHNASYFLNAVRYVERNPIRAGLSERAEEWLWSSASRIGEIQGVRLAKWPVDKPNDWSRFVNEPEPPQLLEFIRQRACQDEPLADPTADCENLSILGRRGVALLDQG